MNNTPSVPGAPAPAATGAPQNAPTPVYPVNRPGEPWQFAPPPVPRQPVPAAMADGAAGAGAPGTDGVLFIF